MIKVITYMQQNMFPLFPEVMKFSFLVSTSIIVNIANLVKRQLEYTTMYHLLPYSTSIQFSLYKYTNNTRY